MTILPPSPPRWTFNYGLGWIGFVHHHSRLANLISWMTRYWRGPRYPSVSHVFVVSSQSTCIEANSPGVQETSLVQYFYDPRYIIYLRQPRNWTYALGYRIFNEARKYVGYGYDFDLLAADAISYSLVGKIVNDLTGDALDEFLTALTDSPKKMICDKLAHIALQAQPELRNLGSLALAPCQNNPQRLFTDDGPFEPIVTQIKGTPV